MTKKFAVVRAASPYNVILRRTSMRELRAISSTIHAMIKFLTPGGFATLIARTSPIYECQWLEKKKPAPEGERAPEQERLQAKEEVVLLGRNLEAYVDDIAIKSKTKQDMVTDIANIFHNLRKINMKLNPKKCSFGVTEGKFLGYMVTSEGIQANPKKKKAVSDMQSPETLREMQSLSGKLAALNRFVFKSVERSLPFFETLKNITKENKDEYRWTEAAEKAFQELKKFIMEFPTLTTPIKKEPLFLYLAMSRDAVSGVIMGMYRETSSHTIC
nr:reverse transcriptase domain-containing protein [Tanacetum cinerariifolium]